MNNGMNYLKNCIFVGESGFDINMRRSRGWSPWGSKTIIETPSTKATSHSVLGAISADGVVNLKLRESGNLKRRKVLGATKERNLKVNYLFQRALLANTIFSSLTIPWISWMNSLK
jgi:hypothetical protein